MLIAIMGFTFDSIFENQTQFILQLKLEVLNDYSFLFSKEKIQEFLYLAKLKDVDEENDDEWGGRIKAMKKSNRSLFEDLKTTILSMMRTEVKHDVERIDARVKDMNEKIDQNKQSQEKLKENVEKLKDNLEKHREEMKEKLEKLEGNQKKTETDLSEMMKLLKIIAEKK